MTKDAKFVMQLRERADVITTKLGGPFDVIDPVTATALRAAASRIEALESRQRVLLDALEPFATIAVQAEQAWTSGQYYQPEDYVRPAIRLKHFTRARAALAGDA